MSDSTVTAERPVERPAYPGAPPGAGVRPPPRAIQVLLPVWGYEFVQSFLRLSLPTLLAPGNLPALAGTLPTEFVFLTGRRDEAVIRESAGYRALSAVCGVRFNAIDDLIAEGNHSTTVTLAYTRAVRRTGAAMLDTCFFFLVSDYIVADGSLRSALQPILGGASGVQAGNFQIVAEDAQPWLDRALGRAGDALALPPRELMRQALTCIHPATVANTVNLPVSHNSHSNRLFWWVDDETLIGRFYLLHMLCIRPELVDFVIGASCDYSFIPEMCPSGNVAVMTDSDAYLVVETQARRHESYFLRLGPCDPRELAAALSEWTTAKHRDNARHTLIFHADGLPASLGSVVAEADAYVAGIGDLLRRKAMPHRNHPYWRGAIAAHDSQAGRRPNEQDWQLMLGARATWSLRVIGLVRRLVLGRPPEVRRWHPRWADMIEPRLALEEILARPDHRLLIVSSRPTVITNWIADRSSQVQRLPIGRFARLDADERREMRGRFDACYLELSEPEIERGPTVLDEIVPMLRPGGDILIAAFNDRWAYGAEKLGDSATTHAYRLIHRRDVELTVMRAVRSSRWQWAANAGVVAQSEALLGRNVLLAPFRAIVLAGQSLIAFGANLATRNRARDVRTRGQIVSSVFVRLRVKPQAATAEVPPPADLVASAAAALRPAAATKEPQYERLLEVEREAGIATLGLMSNQVWHEDPRRLVFMLARYKFVSKMLGGQQSVAEVGCGDAFGTRIVQQEVDSVTVYDFDPLFIRDIDQRRAAKWPLEARLHDILDGPLPAKYNAIYSLDVIEHIPLEQEEQYVGNLHRSLYSNGILIVGSPSLESQAYASPQSKIGHINCKSGRALKALLENYFHSVFLFSMNDEVVHTGFYPMAHYLFAVCAYPRQ